VGRSQATDAGNEEMQSTYDALYPTSTPHARARRSFPSPPKMLALVKHAAAMKGLAGLTDYGNASFSRPHIHNRLGRED
jgi:hypothetical protein